MAAYYTLHIAGLTRELKICPISEKLDAAFLAHHLAMNGQSYAPYTGILQEETAETISCVGQIGKDGMKETDREILKIMLEH